MSPPIPSPLKWAELALLYIQGCLSKHLSRVMAFFWPLGVSVLSSKGFVFVSSLGRKLFGFHFKEFVAVYLVLYDLLLSNSFANYSFGFSVFVIVFSFSLSGFIIPLSSLVMYFFKSSSYKSTSCLADLWNNSPSQVFCKRHWNVDLTNVLSGALNFILSLWSMYSAPMAWTEF